MLLPKIVSVKPFINPAPTHSISRKPGLWNTFRNDFKEGSASPISDQLVRTIAFGVFVFCSSAFTVLTLSHPSAPTRTFLPLSTPSAVLAWTANLMLASILLTIKTQTQKTLDSPILFKHNPFQTARYFYLHNFISAALLFTSPSQRIYRLSLREKIMLFSVLCVLIAKSIDVRILPNWTQNRVVRVITGLIHGCAGVMENFLPTSDLERLAEAREYIRERRSRTI